MTRIVLVLGFIGLLIGSALAQSLTKQADRQFDQLAYAKAADLYEKALTNPATLTDAERRAAKIRLAYSYRQARDTRNAERAYRELIAEGDSSADYAQYHLYYAQALISNGKYHEAEGAYNKYYALQAAAAAGAKSESGSRTGGSRTRGSKLYQDVTALTRTAGTYTIEFLDINTRQSEFSPMLYKNGLVFVSADNKRWSKLFKRKNTPFLNLYYLPELSTLNGSKGSRKRLFRLDPGQFLGRDEYTTRTANDSKTVGFFGGTNLNLGYEEQPISESERFSKTINSKYHEGPSTFAKDGSRVIFTRNNYTGGQYRTSTDGVNKLKLYTATQTNGYWSDAQELPFNSDEFSTGHPSLANGRNGEPDQLLYFSSDRPGGFGGTDIYVSTWTDGQWSEPVNLGERVNSKGNEMFPFVDEKGNLYVASDGHGGLGGLDLFYIQLTGESQPAGELLNLGEPLNSPTDDFGIVTDGARNGGYFSSNRRRGGADDDVYRFTRAKAVNACRELTISVFDAETKVPLVNTSVTVDNPANDSQKQLKTDGSGVVRICLTADSDTRFVVSQEGYMTNKVGFSTKDLSDTQPSRLEIPLAKPTIMLPAGATMLRGRVLTQADRTPITGANVVAVNECDGSLQETVTDSEGHFLFTAKPGCSYLLEAIKEGMGTTGSHIEKDGSGVTELLMFKKGDVITIDNIYYDRNKATIRPDAATELDKVVALMQKYPAMTIEMGSHTDSRATTQYNKTLSANRAKSATAYLKSKGIAAKRMTAKGYGESALLNACVDGVDCPEADHQQNRRTEIKILKLE
ncbi:carboxypeptidase regulatory-like domain-containing protein [Spirosoma arcticum]